MRIVQKLDTANDFIVSHTFTISKRTDNRVTRRFLIVANGAMGHFMARFKQDGEGKSELQRRVLLSFRHNGQRRTWKMRVVVRVIPRPFPVILMGNVSVGPCLATVKVKSFVPDPGAPMELSLVD
jgi:hypothetical protein